MSVVAIDAGNHETKFYDGKRFVQFPSILGYDWRERNLKQQQGEHDYEWEYKDQKGFAGTLALYESECAESRKGDSKAHPDALLRILIALHQFTDGIEHKIVVGQPIKTHTKEEKETIKEMIVGRHEIAVNGRKKHLLITRCEVAAEGVTAGLLVPGGGTVRVIDIGSGTVNFGTLIDRRFNDKGSFTLTNGMETVRTADPVSFGRQIALKALSNGWGKNDAVYLCGGGAEALQESLRAYFINAQLIIGDPVTANVRAFYLIAGKLYGQ
ncbi:MAG: ParM/StbA family protein [Candidatus Cohnella colombiensis]|uniref:ParM/StbA family protein n=1 Tax=Candidatus Cohnella colombiensis TaxID=3121368 RepID=A0AA95JF39_9BACL|nr:MAG: ParM/StbA family protein [Cohnella sp.]